MDSTPAALFIVAFIAIAVFGIHHCGYENGEHAGKWSERCRHTTCAGGIPKWDTVDGAEACVCITTARSKAK